MTITAKFKTVLTNGFTSQNGDNPAASGGVTFLQLKKDSKGQAWMRSVDSNGRHESVGKSSKITNEKAQGLIARAAAREENDKRNGR